MCNRFKSKLQAMQIRALMATDLDVLEEAATFEAREDQRPSQEALLILERDGRTALGTGFWGFPKAKGAGLVINARSENVRKIWFWRDTVHCWIPVTSWIEYLVDGKRNIPQEIALPSGEPFLLAGVCGLVNGARRWAMQMQDAPEHLAHLCDRMPLAYGFDVIGQAAPAQLIDQVVIAPA